jgi:HEAT repeat protein
MRDMTVKRMFKNVVIVIITFFTLAVTIKAQNDYAGKIVNSKRYAKNLSACISSKNEGVKNMAVYYAGKYKVTGVAKALIDQLRNEESPRTRAIIIYSLLMIGDEECITAAYQYANGEMDEYIKKVFNDVTAEFDTLRSLAVSANDIR